MKGNFKKALNLFLVFFKIGAFTFGGGYAMVPLIEKEVAEKNNWITSQEILDIIAIAESTPGPISINMATFIGYKICGIIGAIVCTFAIVFPAFLIISIIALFLTQFQSATIVQFAFNGIRIGVLSLLINALVKMYKQSPKDIFSYIIMTYYLKIFFRNPA